VDGQGRSGPLLGVTRSSEFWCAGSLTSVPVLMSRSSTADIHVMPYPPRRTLAPLPEFVGTATTHPDPTVQARVDAFVVEQYLAGRSLREVAELTDRSFSAVRSILGRHGVQRRDVGATRMRSGHHGGRQ
jgi:hypothetical protein